jgi:hypothetical protein
MKMSSLPNDRILYLASIRKNTTRVATENMTQLKISMVYANGFVGFLVKWGSSRRPRTELSERAGMAVVMAELLWDASLSGDPS